ncbi:Decaprenyl diphosphate synthase-like [Macleaya cordata]|uniref:Alkyl transferase n=1 Tax=Macleaya cordata TaxID=56857 RepID=A0A200PLK2_MACCD|nr:Decaprenyl diphosphate synthase-like [Macleaya cordata]
MFSLQFPLPSIESRLSPYKSKSASSILNDQSRSSSTSKNLQIFPSLCLPKSRVLSSATEVVVEELEGGVNGSRVSDARVPSEQWPLPAGLRREYIPNHVAVIMDGNVRWARQRGLPSSSGHEAGIRSLRELVELCCKWGIRVLTVFAFSSDNWTRPQMEVDFLLSLFERGLEEELENFMREDIQISVIGDSSKLPISLRKLITNATETTKNNSRLQLIVAVSYSGRYDIVQACQSIAYKVKDGLIKPEDIDESLISQELETNCTEFPYPDLLIRTSGELRMSNFMLWQLAYTELFFVNSLWPDFGEKEFAEALHSFQQRQRRYGGRNS